MLKTALHRLAIDVMRVAGHATHSARGCICRVRFSHELAEHVRTSVLISRSVSFWSVHRDAERIEMFLVDSDSKSLSLYEYESERPLVAPGLAAQGALRIRAY